MVVRMMTSSWVATARIGLSAALAWITYAAVVVRIASTVVRATILSLAMVAAMKDSNPMVTMCLTAAPTTMNYKAALATISYWVATVATCSWEMTVMICSRVGLATTSYSAAPTTTTYAVALGMTCCGARQATMG